MNISSQEDLRLKQRSTVNLKALVNRAGQKAQQHCRITNLSATGARLNFAAKLPLTVGMNLDIQISIPETIMYIPNSGEIIWVEQQRDTYTVGIRFDDFLSETMMQQILKDN